MNRKGLKELSLLSDKIQDALGVLECFIEDEENTYDNLPENFQNGDQGSEIESGLDSLRDAASNLEEALNSIGYFDFDVLKTKKQKDKELKEEEKIAAAELEKMKLKEIAKAKIKFLMASKALTLSKKLKENNK